MTLKVQFEERTCLPEYEDEKWCACFAGNVFPELLVFGKTKKEVFEELMNSLRIKVIHDSNIGFL